MIKQHHTTEPPPSWFSKRHPGRARRKGAALVEAAVVLPIFVLLTLAVIEFGRGMMVAQLITTGARLGARDGIIEGNANADVIATVKEWVAGSTNVTKDDVTVSVVLTPHPSNSTTGTEILNAEAGDLVTVSVSIPFDKVSFGVSKFLKGKSVSGEATMRHE